MIPDLEDDIMLLGTYAYEDVKSVLGRITLTMANIRKRVGWKADDLKHLKMIRSQLHPYMERAKTHSLSQLEHTELQRLIVSALQLNLSSVDDLPVA